MRVFLMVIALLWASAVFAQTGVPTSYTLRVYGPGGSSALSTLSVTVAQLTCNQAPMASPPPPNENPAVWRWTDPANAGRDCAYTDTARMTALADGSYEGTVSASNADGSSAETARVGFTRRRANPPAAPTNPRLTP